MSRRNPSSHRKPKKCVPQTHSNWTMMEGWLTVSLLPKHIAQSLGMTLMKGLFSCNNVLVLPLLLATNHATAVTLGGTWNFHCFLLQKQHNGTIVTKNSRYVNARNKTQTLISLSLKKHWLTIREHRFTHPLIFSVCTMLPPSEHPGFIALGLTINLNAL